ncbi:unnamed protein product [Bursaphelenchus xylophilus]|uniref:(pine wood nematode) hypothetical protein n=1 Tax=Bursaphelenchus xylophilus TaxID=6326 RepID=A0A1I7RZB6_BURXY|nr:unnamed protein product [Bursaphelenchus xylophilus]CAG9106643.1 unnamed protein product [Bursaphelenchus xylophilus]
MKSADELNGRFLVVNGIKYLMFILDSFVFRYQKMLKEPEMFCRFSLQYHCNTPRCKASIVVHQYESDEPGPRHKFYVDEGQLNLSHNHKPRKNYAKDKVVEAMWSHGVELSFNELTARQVFRTIGFPVGIPEELNERSAVSIRQNPGGFRYSSYRDLDLGNLSLEIARDDSGDLPPPNVPIEPTALIVRNASRRSSRSNSRRRSSTGNSGRSRSSRESSRSSGIIDNSRRPENGELSGYLGESEGSETDYDYRDLHGLEYTFSSMGTESGYETSFSDTEDLLEDRSFEYFFNMLDQEDTIDEEEEEEESGEFTLSSDDTESGYGSSESIMDLFQ